MQVLSLDQAAFRVGIVRRTLERMLAEGTGPTKVQVSKRRVGILEGRSRALAQLAPTLSARQGRRLTRAAVDGEAPTAARVMPTIRTKAGITQTDQRSNVGGDPRHEDRP